MNLGAALLGLLLAASFDSAPRGLAGSTALTTSQDQQDRPSPLKDALLSADRDYYSIAFSPDGKTLAAGGSRFIRIISVEKFAETQVLGVIGKVDELIFDSTGRALVGRSRDQDSRVWDSASWSPVKFAVEDYYGLRPASFSGFVPPGSWFLLPQRGRGLRLWNMGGLWGKPRSVTQALLQEYSGISLGHLTATATAGSSYFVGDDQGYLYHLAVLGGIAPPETYRAVAIAPRGPASAQVFRPHLGEISAVSLSADAKLCVTAGMDGKVKLWSVEQIPPAVPRPRGSKDPEPRWEIPGHEAVLSGTGRLLAVADAEGVGVYHAASGLPVSWNPTRLSKGRIVRLRFSPDGKSLAAILCRCADCTPGDKVASIRMKTRLIDHGGALIVWE